MSDHPEARRTALYEEHVKAGGKLVPFAGFMLPIQYEGIAAEHHRCRTAVGLFDVSHMGEIVFRGPEAAKVVNRLVTNNVVSVKPGRAVYTPCCRPDGGIVDDMIFYKKSDTEWFVCVNASNKDKDYAWFVEQTRGECEVVDLSEQYSQIAVQGPNAPELLARVLGAEVATMKPFWFITKDYRGQEIIFATTGYTGEPGGEIYVPSAVAADLWRELMDKGSDLGVGPIGLGARDSLRMEMKYCLYGNDIDDTTTPIEAGLQWTVKFDKGDFNGRDVHLKQHEDGPARHLVQFVVEGKGVPRHNYAVYSGDRKIGHVTSGTMSPSLKIPIGIAYVEPPFQTVGQTFEIDLMGLRRVQARVVEAPVYRKAK
ncbi:MAG TPA: glycine cleavage system aminomethyltransferase GcvT [Myxococcota bacterium]|nr:glycine cleavage system aminomethyltransferase GcvT [Myxococcota bacterium]HOA12678.1 glycine cleavage system aminomethyltransferase GcvT [Myxococcota bacterium]HOH76156.1 glycine cleavage system aminomethyltransferase GcvT [Myxococcota bacterium]HPV03610.1 glycine cleavage system aminomethyltransferase GcvT [Myxococcota bacterium]